jgi:hypothetical protein
MKQPAAPSGIPAYDRRIDHLVLGGHRARALQPRLGREAARGDDGVHPHRRHRRRQRDERQEAVTVEADVVRSDGVFEALPCLVEAEARIGDRSGERGVEGRLVADHPDRRSLQMSADPRDRPIAEVTDVARRSVERLDHSGVTYAAVIPPSMISD